MSLVGRVGRKRPRARIALVVLYSILTIGALTTLYPFALMVSTGWKGPTDQNDNRLVPAYWQGEEELFQKYVDDKYAGDVAQIASIRAASRDDSSAHALPASGELLDDYERFLSTLPIDYWQAGFRLAPNQVTSRLTALYQQWLRQRFPSIDALNKAYVEENVAFQTVQPPAEPLDRKTWKPTKDAKYVDWLEFKATLPVEYRIPVRATRIWQEFVKGKFRNQFDDVPPEIRGAATTFESLVLPKSGALLAEFRATRLPDRYKIRSVESLWAPRTEPMPVEAFERAFVAANASAIRREFASRNYRYVLDYILINGRAVLNTVLFCSMAILTQLIVNPLAAYALSRYPVSASGKILIFLLATMAFPAEVAMIPSFLLLKDLGLLNTFAALVLPSAASGYMIFLLKGFFDSLPQEFYEAGQLDGARETTLLARIAIPLSRPVLGYLALMAFMASYSTFMYAFLVAQDQRMWTLMVWIYQLQTSSPKAVTMAALALAALPTLVVFLAAQRVIMRGIVLPGER